MYLNNAEAAAYLETLKTMIAAKDWSAVIDQTGNGSGNCYLRGIWACAMTAKYGPGHIHESRVDAEGRPTAETLAAFPRLAERMKEAEETIANCYVWRLDDVSDFRCIPRGA